MRPPGAGRALGYFSGAKKSRAVCMVEIKQFAITAGEGSCLCRDRSVPACSFTFTFPSGWLLCVSLVELLNVMINRSNLLCVVSCLQSCIFNTKQSYFGFSGSSLYLSTVGICILLSLRCSGSAGRFKALGQLWVVAKVECRNSKNRPD